MTERIELGTEAAARFTEACPEATPGEVEVLMNLLSLGVGMTIRTSIVAGARPEPRVVAGTKDLGTFGEHLERVLGEILDVAEQFIGRMTARYGEAQVRRLSSLITKEIVTAYGADIESLAEADRVIARMKGGTA